MNVLRLSLAAVASGFLAVALWWLSRDGVMVLPPVTEPPVEGMIERVRSTTWLLLAATASAGASSGPLQRSWIFSSSAVSA